MNKRWAIILDTDAAAFNHEAQPDPRTIMICKDLEEATLKAKEEITECDADEILIVEITAFVQIKSKRSADVEETKLEVKDENKTE